MSDRIWKVAEGTNEIQSQGVQNTQGIRQGREAIEYIPFPDALRGKYQCFTQADLTKLRAVGYTEPFLNVEQGVGRYIEWLEANAGFLANPL